jgi:hypothetical protein
MYIFISTEKGVSIIVFQEQEDLLSAFSGFLLTSGQFSLDLLMLPWILLRTL